MLNYLDKIKEENDNIDDIDKIEKRFQMSLKNLKNIDKNEGDKVIKILIDLHLIYSDFIWQYEQMYEMVKNDLSI